MPRGETIAWTLAIIVATVLTVLGTVYLVNNVLAPSDPTDPLAKQGGLKPQQKPTYPPAR